MSIFDFEGCRKRLFHFIFLAAFIIGIIYFGGGFLAKLFDKNSPENNESTKTELENTNEETANIVFAVIGSVFVVVLFLYIVFSVFAGNVLLNLLTGRNVYVGNTFLIGFILALIAVGSFYLDYKFNDFNGAKMVIVKIIRFLNKE
ncbi:MAG: hypothetical protein LBQ89_03645 [Treponema sp.]|jgi:Na+/H+ antiporter NhaC|nr:hypothetical protein [Treponema sp.]